MCCYLGIDPIEEYLALEKEKEEREKRDAKNEGSS